MKQLRQMPRQEKGFTVVELLVVAPIVILAIGAFLALIITMTGDVIASRASNVLAYDVQDALNRIETDTKLSTTFLAVSDELEASQTGQGYDDALERFYNSNDPGDPAPKGDMLILNMLATTGNPNDASSGLVYLDDQPNDCSSDHVAGNKPMTYNVVYFLKDGALWRRTIMPADYASSSYRCAEPWQRPSCSPTVTEAFCATEDIKLVEGVTPDTFSVRYFTSASDGVANSAATTGYGTGSLAARAAALESSTTVNVTITARQTAAGHDIEQAATIRATRLDVNASTIAPTVPDTMPSAPVISGTFEAPNKAVFTWPHSTGGNVTYLVQYRINSGTYTTLASGTTVNSRTITANHTDNVDIRVRASNSAGTSSYTYSSVTIPLWVPLVLKNSWLNYEQTYSRAAYTMSKDGVVLVKGLVRRTGTAVGEEVIATLPEGYRPSASLMFGGATNGHVSSRIDVNADGNIERASGSEGWMSLETIRFVPDGRYTRTTLTPLNGWSQYGGEWAPASYVQVDDGRIFVQGFVRSGTWTSGTRIFDLPNSLRPAGYMHIAGRSNGWGYFSVQHNDGTANGFVAKAQGNTYLSVNANFHPASYSGWNNLTLNSGAGWVWYGSPYPTAQYTKSPTDNMVSLKGLVRSGSGIIATLPAGFRPKERILYTTVAADAWARIDIEPNGYVSLQAGSNAWTSLDGITFMAEQ